MTPAAGRTAFARPPRAIGLNVQLRVLLGSFRSQFGWALLGFGSVFFWGVAMKSELPDLRFRPDRISTTRGVFLYCVQTNYTRDRSHRDFTYEVHYRYEVNGRGFTGMSYITGSCPGGPQPIEYLKAQPAVSRIIGMRMHPFPASSWIVTVVPGVGLVLVMLSLLEGRKRLALLRDGSTALARLKETKMTNVSSNRGRTYILTFEFAAPRGAGRVSIRTAQTAPFEQQPEQLVFYDPENVTRAALQVSYPGKLSAGQDGQPVVSSAPAYLVLPVLVTFANLWRALAG